MKRNIVQFWLLHVDGKFSDRLRAALERGNTPDVDSVENDFDGDKKCGIDNVQKRKSDDQVIAYQKEQEEQNDSNNS